MDSRDLIEEREEMKDTIFQDFIVEFPHYEEMTGSFEDILFNEEEIQDWKEVWENELERIKMIDNLESEVSSEWGYGITFIEEDEFVDYAKEMAEECGYLPKDLPWWIENAIDWDQVADSLREDYNEIEFDNVTYLYRD
jgi:hypothetical protein